MKGSAAVLVFVFLCLETVSAQGEQPPPPPLDETTPAPETPPAAATESPVETLGAPTPAKRGWVGRMLHPFSSVSAPAPVVRDPKLRNLALDLQVSPQTVKLSEVRQLDVKLIVTNKGKRGITLDFPNDQRIDIYLTNSAGAVLTKWSETRAFKDKPGTLLINPQEHVEYNEKISTRELTPDKVFIAEAFFPKYPELRARQKFLTAP